jgi:hypothetical protein
MSLSQLSSPTAVKLALEECRRIGRPEFLRLYGFGQSREYPLQFEDQKYDSKAIAGVAHRYQFPELGPLQSDEFSGGVGDQGAARRIFKLGFQVEGLQRRPIDWTLNQCELVSETYFDCLRRKLAKQPFNRNQALDRVATMTSRTRGSVDYKFQNIDAILGKADLPRLNDAVAENWQELLRFVVLDPLAKRLTTVSQSNTLEVQTGDPSHIFVDSPHLHFPIEDDPDTLVSKPSKTDFAKRDAQNRELGARGEEFVVATEKRRLKDAGRPDLAEKVVWSSKEVGDGLGYDIESFGDDGEVIFIEVKATNRGKSAAFFLTSTELSVSEKMGQRYRLYRVFNLSEDPRIYILWGPLRDKMNLEPQVFLGRPI